VERASGTRTSHRPHPSAVTRRFIALTLLDSTDGDCARFPPPSASPRRKIQRRGGACMRKARALRTTDRSRRGVLGRVTVCNSTTSGGPVGELAYAAQLAIVVARNRSACIEDQSDAGWGWSRMYAASGERHRTNTAAAFAVFLLSRRCLDLGSASSAWSPRSASAGERAKERGIVDDPGHGPSDKCAGVDPRRAAWRRTHCLLVAAAVGSGAMQRTPAGAPFQS